jgi:phosphoribosylformylglycinamidine synthase
MKDTLVSQENLTRPSIREQLNTAKISGFEYDLIKKLIGREPNYVELMMFGAMWSEHCAYKNSKPLLRLFPTKSNKVKVLAGPGENAGIIDIGEDVHVAFKIESHNRPTAIEPFQGATTGVGGILRDILTLGARPIAFFNSLHFGPTSNERAKYLLTHAVEGIAHYGNCTGVPTLGGQLVIDSSYTENPLVNAMCIGLMEVVNPIPSAAIGVGNPLLYVGSETGRDGLGGAAFASSGLSAKSSKDRPAVQIGDPFLGKLLIESCLEAFKSGYVISSQDMGAAGLTCACCEMSAKGNVGIELDLNKVPTRGKLEPHEYLLSESQERMLMVIQKDKVDEVVRIFERWGLQACVVGQVTDTERVKIFHDGLMVVDLPGSALTDGAPVYQRSSEEPKISVNVLGSNDLEATRTCIESILLKKLNSDDFRSRSWIYGQFDQQVQVNTVFGPGKADAALTRLRDKQGNPLKMGLAATVDCNPRYVKYNPFLGSQIAVAEAARNIACVGGEALALTDNLNFGNPEHPESFWYLEQSVKGIVEGCKALDLAVVGGNVSLYNEFSDGRQILPTPVIGLVGKVKDVNKSVGINFKNEGDTIWLIGSTFNETECPKLDWKRELALYELLQNLTDSSLIKSAHDLSEGGLSIALVESIIHSGLGAYIEINKDESLRLDSLLFGESQSRAIITTEPDLELTSEKIEVIKIGRVTQDGRLILTIHGIGELLNLKTEDLQQNIKSNV